MLILVMCKNICKRLQDVFSWEKAPDFIKRKYFTLILKMKLIKTILINCIGKFCYRHNIFKIWQLIYDSSRPELMKNIRKYSGAHLHWSATFIKLQIERQQFTNTVLYPECFCEVFRKFFDQDRELFIRGFKIIWVQN